MNKQYAVVTNVEEFQLALSRCRKAQAAFAKFSQEQVDKIFLAAASAANKARIPLAKPRKSLLLYKKHPTDGNLQKPSSQFPKNIVN